MSRTHQIPAEISMNGDLVPAFFHEADGGQSTGAMVRCFASVIINERRSPEAAVKIPSGLSAPGFRSEERPNDANAP
jgi:hypothetical protein